MEAKLQSILLQPDWWRCLALRQWTNPILFFQSRNYPSLLVVHKTVRIMQMSSGYGVVILVTILLSLLARGELKCDIGNLRGFFHSALYFIGMMINITKIMCTKNFNILIRSLLRWPLLKYTQILLTLISIGVNKCLGRWSFESTHS